MSARASLLIALLAACNPRAARPEAAPETSAAAAIPPAPRPAPPLANLAPAWTSTECGADLVLARAFVCSRYDPDKGLVLDAASLADGRRTAPLAFTGRAPDPFHLFPAGDVLVAQTATDRLTAVRADGSRAWEIRFDHVVTGAVARSSGGDLALAIMTAGVRNAPDNVDARLFAHDAATGALRWQVTLPGSDAALLASHGARLAVETWDQGAAKPRPRALAMLDAASGRLRWSRPLDARCTFPTRALDDQRLVYRCGDIVVLDAATGAERARFPAPPDTAVITSLALQGDRLLIWTRYGAAQALDAGTGALRWRNTLRTLDFDATADAVFVRSDGGVIHALDPATGASLWRWGNGGGEQYDGASFHVTRANPGEVELIASIGGTLTGFARRDAPLPAAPVTVTGVIRIDGRPAPSVRVRVGDDVSAPTDRRGRYTVTTTTPGVLHVRPDWSDLQKAAPRPCVFGKGSLMSRDAPSHEPTVDLAFTSRPYDCGRSCDCE